MTDMRPSFIYIGPDKSGSTWLYQLCRAHPQIFMPDVKELFFFDRYYSRGLDWYQAKFAGRGPQHLAAGEICHDYLYSPEAAARIHGDLPGVKVMTMLRDPIARTFSHWQFRLRSGDTRASFEEDLKATPAIFDMSCYATHLPAYLDRFGPERTGIFAFQDLKERPADLVAHLCQFIGVPVLNEAAFDPGQKTNAASKARNPAMVFALRQTGQALRRLGLERVVGQVKSSALVRKALFRPVKPGEIQMRPETKRMLQERFAPHNAALEDVLSDKVPELWRSYDDRP